MYPAAPWQMHGHLWVSLFRVREGDHPERPAGIYGAALVSYVDPSPLTYSELLVARTVDRRVRISDIWVDSADSRDGGRELWAIPKDLAEFTHASEGSRVQRTSWAAALDGRPVVSAEFADVSRAMPRLPFKGATTQVREDGEEVRASLTGSARSLPCRARWHFDRTGPLAWLAGKRPLASFRMADFSMSFG